MLRRTSSLILVTCCLALVACGDDDSADVSSNSDTSADPADAETTTSTDDLTNASTTTVAPTDAASTSTGPSGASGRTDDDGDDTTALEAAIAAGIDDGSLCPDSYRDESMELGYERASTDAGEVVLLTCELYAYNIGYQVAGWDGTTITPIDIPLYDSEADTIDLVAGVSGIGSLDGNRLNVYVKYRGPGDCGSVNDWTFTVDGLEITQVRERQCEDDAPGDPADPDTWPIVYPS